MKKNTLLVLSLLCLSTAGCAKIAHLDQLLTLKAMGDEGDKQEKLVTKQDKEFKELLTAVESDQITTYKNKKQVRRAFGDPIYTKTAPYEGVEREVWMYRYAVKFFDSDKVYIYFDEQGNTLHWEVIHPEAAKEAPAAS